MDSRGLARVCALLLCSRAAAHSGAGAENHLGEVNVDGVRVALDAGASVTLNSTVLVDGSFVQFSVVNPGWAQSGDWVGMYAADAAPNATAPLKWSYLVPYCAGYNGTGACSGVFQVYAVRQSVVFLLFSGGVSRPTVVAQSAPLPPSDAREPVHPRVVPAGAAAGAYAVVWTTGMGATRPFLAWGTAAGQLTNNATAVLSVVSRSALCGPPAVTTGWMDLGVTAAATVEGAAQLFVTPTLPQGGGVLYYALADEDGRRSVERSFVVPPLPGPVFPFLFSGFGDLGRGSYDMGITWSEYGGASRDTAGLLASDAARPPPTRPAFIHTWGDISYAVGFLQTWDEFLWMASQYAASTPYLVGVGNHEALAPGTSSWSYYGSKADSGGECSVVATTLLPMPPPFSAHTPWYSYAAGPVTVVVMSSEHDFTTGSPQLQWLTSTLAGVDRSLTPWLLVSIHRPMYINSNFGPTEPTGDVRVMNLLQAYVEPVTNAAQVDLLLYGHNHRWERVSAAYRNKTVLPSSPVVMQDGTVVHVYDRPQASVHYVAGSAGAAFTQNDCASVAGPCPEWSEEVGYAHGYLRCTALNATALYWEYVGTAGGGGTGNVLDRVLLVKAGVGVVWASNVRAGQGGGNLGVGAIAAIAAGGTLVVLALLAVPLFVSGTQGGRGGASSASFHPVAREGGGSSQERAPLVGAGGGYGAV